MKTYLMIITLAVGISLWPATIMGGHFEGKETNVVVLVCVIDDHPPHRIHVRSLSINATQKPMPTISTKTSCAQALHELMTAGFEIAESDMRLYFVFVLTRIDQSPHKH